MPAPVIPNPLACPEHCPRHCSGTGGALPDSAGENDGGARRPVSGGGGGGGGGSDSVSGRGSNPRSRPYRLPWQRASHHGNEWTCSRQLAGVRRSGRDLSAPFEDGLLRDARSERNGERGPRTSREPLPAPRRRRPSPARPRPRPRRDHSTPAQPSSARDGHRHRPCRDGSGFLGESSWCVHGGFLSEVGPHSVPGFVEHEPGCGAGRRYDASRTGAHGTQF